MPSFAAWWRRYGPGYMDGSKTLRKRWVYAAGRPVLRRAVEDRFRQLVGLHAAAHRRTIDVLEFDCTEAGWTELHAAMSNRFSRASLAILLRRVDDADPEFWTKLSGFARGAQAEVAASIGDKGPLTWIFAEGEKSWNPKSDDPRVWMFRHERYGVYVDCSRDLDEAGLTRYVEGMLGSRISPPATRALLALTGNDLNRLRSSCGVLQAAVERGSLITPRVISELLPPSPSSRFVTDLIANRRADAARAAPFVTSIPFVIGSLDWHLAVLVSVRSRLSLVGRKASNYELAEAAGVLPFQVAPLRRHAPLYDHQTVGRRYDLLLRTARRSRRESDPALVLTPLIAEW